MKIIAAHYQWIGRTGIVIPSQSLSPRPWPLAFKFGFRAPLRDWTPGKTRNRREIDCDRDRDRVTIEP